MPPPVPAPEMIAKIPGVPHLVNVVEGGTTPVLSKREYTVLGAADALRHGVRPTFEEESVYDHGILALARETARRA